MAVGAVGLSFVSVAFDARVTQGLSLWLGWQFTGGAEGAASVLAAVAGSMITLAGVVFSMTLVALSLASSQLGPRLLRNFMRDTTTQVVLGTFVSTFLYCLLVLRTIRRAEEISFVPHVSVALGVVAAVLSVGVLIYFIHHVSVSMQANEIVARVGKDLIEELNRLFPVGIGPVPWKTKTQEPDADPSVVFSLEASPVLSRGDGYIQFIDVDALIALAKQADLVVRIVRTPGDYMVADCPLVVVWPPCSDVELLRERVNAAFVLGNQRTTGQDIEFVVNQLVEVAVRALSPGLNDPFTAITCLDHLGSALCRLATREWPSVYRYDEKDKLRVVTSIATFGGITDAAFNQIRQCSQSSPAVIIRLLETIVVIAGFVHRPEDRATLLRHAGMVVRGARHSLSEAGDLQAVEERYTKAMRLCGEQDGARG